MNTEYKCVTTVDGIRDYIGGSSIVSFDFETAPDDPYREEDKAALDPARAHIVGCSFSVKEGTGIYVPIAHRIGTNIDKDAFFAFLTAFLMNTTIKLAPCLVRLNTRPLHHIPDLCKPFFSVYASVMSFQFLYIYKSSRLKICPLP